MSPNEVKQLKFMAGMFLNATICAVQQGVFKRTGLVLLVDVQTLDSSNRLTQVNLCLRSLWSSTTVVLKPWTDKTGGIASLIPHISNMIAHGASKLPKLMTTQVCLMCLHKSGKVFANGPPAPPSPNEELMLSTEVDSYLCAVAKAPTGQEPSLCGNLAQSTQTTSSGFNPGWRGVRPTEGEAQGRGHNKGFRGRGGRGGGSSRRGGSSGRGGSGRSSRGLTIINSGIHYHKWWWMTFLLIFGFQWLSLKYMYKGILWFHKGP